MKMLLYVTLNFLWVLLGHCEESFAYDSCESDMQTLLIPHDYDKNVPDASQTGCRTRVEFDYRIQNLKAVKEER